MYIVNKNKLYFKVKTTLDVTKLVDCVICETTQEVYDNISYDSEIELEDVEFYAMIVTDETIHLCNNVKRNNITNMEEEISNFEL